VEYSAKNTREKSKSIKGVYMEKATCLGRWLYRTHKNVNENAASRATTKRVVKNEMPQRYAPPNTIPSQAFLFANLPQAT